MSLSPPFFRPVIKCHPKVTTYIRYAKFEERMNNIENARQVYHRASEELGSDLFSLFSPRPPFPLSLSLSPPLSRYVRVCWPR